MTRPGAVCTSALHPFSKSLSIELRDNASMMLRYTGGLGRTSDTRDSENIRGRVIRGHAQRLLGEMSAQTHLCNQAERVD